MAEIDVAGLDDWKVGNACDRDNGLVASVWIRT